MANYTFDETPFHKEIKKKIKSLKNSLISRDFLAICVEEKYFTKNSSDYYKNINPFYDYCAKYNSTFTVSDSDYETIKEILNMYNVFAVNESYYNVNKNSFSKDSKIMAMDKWVVNHVEKLCDTVDDLISSYTSSTSNIDKLLNSSDEQKIILTNLSIYISLVSFYKDAVYVALSDIFDDTEQNPYDILDSTSAIHEFVENDKRLEQFFLANKVDYDNFKSNVFDGSYYFKHNTEEFNSKILSGEYDKDIISELVYMISRVLSTEADNPNLKDSVDGLFKSYIRKCYAIFYNFCTSENENFMSYLVLDDEFARIQFVGANLKKIILDCSGVFLKILYQLVFGFLSTDVSEAYHFREYLVNLADLFKLLGNGVNLKKRHRFASATLKASLRDSLMLGAKLAAYSVVESLIYNFPIPLSFSKNSKTTNLKEIYEALFILKTIFDRTGGSNPTDFIKGFKDKLNSVKDTEEYKELLQKGGGIVCRSSSITSIHVEKENDNFKFSYLLFNFSSFYTKLSGKTPNSNVNPYLEELDETLLEKYPPSKDDDGNYEKDVDLFTKDIECYFILQYLNLKSLCSGGENLYLNSELIKEEFYKLTDLEKKLLNYAYETQLKNTINPVLNITKIYYTYPEVFVLKARDFLLKNIKNGVVSVIDDTEMLRVDSNGNKIYSDENISLNDNLKLFVSNYIEEDIVAKTIEWEDKLADYIIYISPTLNYMERYCAASYNAKTLLNYLVQYLPTTFLLANSFDWLKDMIDYAFDGVESLMRFSNLYKDDITASLEIKTNFLALETQTNYSLSKKWLKMESEIRSFISQLDTLNEKFFYEIEHIKSLYNSDYFIK